jgi:hypothetical protein
MRHARDSNELFEVASDELWAIVRDDALLCFRVLLLGAFENYFDIRFPHRLAQIPMHEEAAETVQNAAQVIERAGQEARHWLRQISHLNFYACWLRLSPRKTESQQKRL